MRGANNTMQTDGRFASTADAERWGELKEWRLGRGVGSLFITLKLETCNRQLVRKDPFIPRGPVSQWGFQSGWH